MSISKAGTTKEIEMANILVDTANNTGWTKDGRTLTDEQVVKIARGVHAKQVKLVSTGKANVFEVHYNG